MIICLRGLNGSGKSHIVREIMKLYPARVEMRVTGQRRAVGYKLSGIETMMRLFIPGYYDPLDPSIGGADSLRDVEELYSMIWEAYDAGFSVLYESKGRSDGVSRLTDMFHPGLAQVVVVDHPISECVREVRVRGGKMLVETARRHHSRIKSQGDAIQARGYEVSYLRREEAAEKCKSLLAVEGPNVL